MMVTFLGLSGPAACCPQHYTQLVIDRVRQKDFALRDFLDLFHHRLVSLFYRAWEKYRLPLAYERAARTLPEPVEDLFTRSLFCLVGLGTDGLRGRLQIPDAAFLYYSGHFAHAPRNVAALECILGEALRLPVQVVQFQGQWLYLRAEDQSRFSALAEPWGRNCRLGQNVVAGQRVWSVENDSASGWGRWTTANSDATCPPATRWPPSASSFGPTSAPSLTSICNPFCELTRRPSAAWTADPRTGPFLGWNSWLISRVPAGTTQKKQSSNMTVTPEQVPLRRDFRNSWPN